MPLVKTSQFSYHQSTNCFWSTIYGYSSLISYPLIYFLSISLIINKFSLSFQHRDFDEIMSHLRKREPLILESLSVQKLNRRVNVEGISDPLNDMDSDPSDDGMEMHRQLKTHQVNILFFVSPSYFLPLNWYCSWLKVVLHASDIAYAINHSAISQMYDLYDIIREISTMPGRMESQKV